MDAEFLLRDRLLLFTSGLLPVEGGAWAGLCISPWYSQLIKIQTENTLDSASIIVMWCWVVHTILVIRCWWHSIGTALYSSSSSLQWDLFQQLRHAGPLFCQLLISLLLLVPWHSSVPPSILLWYLTLLMTACERNLSSFFLQEVWAANYKEHTTELAKKVQLGRLVANCKYLLNISSEVLNPSTCCFLFLFQLASRPTYFLRVQSIVHKVCTNVVLCA